MPEPLAPADRQDAAPGDASHYDISRLGLTRAPFWWTLIVGLAGLVVFATLPGRPLILHTLQKLAHPCVFGVITLSALVLQQQRARSGVVRQYLTALVCAVLIGALTEALQVMTHRDPSWRDVLLDTRGALLALALAACFDRRTRPTARYRRHLFPVLVMLLMGVTLTPLAITLGAYVNRSLRFPVLFAADHWIDLLLVSTTGAPATRDTLPAPYRRYAGEQALRVPLFVRPAGAVSLDEPHRHWRGYRTLVIEVTNPAPNPLGLVLRIHDHAHAAADSAYFIRPLSVGAEARQTFTIALKELAQVAPARSLDVDDIANVTLAHDGLAGTEEFWLNRVSLE